MTTEMGPGLKELIDDLIRAVNEDADGEKTATVLEMAMPDGACATVLILSGRRHDEIQEIIENLGPVKVLPS